MSDEATTGASTARSHARPPLRPRRLIGRDAELRDVAESIALSPVTTLTGPGGVGKTALAIAVAA
ncbi:hypothetical protein, partial [Klebsiella pneumoniae]|uniref:hypothetical protein n=1 Tax=Klebsiella pneumoniae TaxID=573 RepID=UPI003EE265FD